MDFTAFEEISINYFNHRVDTVLGKNKRKHYPKIINSFKPNDYIVDAGCGDNKFNEFFPNLTAFDIVDYGNQNYVCSIMDAPIKEKSQDGVICLGVLHECPDEYHEPNIEKMLKWLRPGGKLIMRCKAEPVKRKHHIDAKIHKDNTMIKMLDYLDKGLWSVDRIDYFTEKFNLLLAWRQNTYVTRHTEWDGNYHNSVRGDDIVFNGYVWCWIKNAEI